MTFRSKDTLRLSLPRILGDPPARLTFQLTSEYITITLPAKRVHNVINATVIDDRGDSVTVECTDDSIVLLHSVFIKLQDIYWYPFVSSRFAVESLGISEAKDPWLELTVPRRYKSITMHSLVNGNIKQFELWAEDTGTYFFSLQSGNNCINMLFRTAGVSIFEGVAHILLPTLTVLVGYFLHSDAVTKTVQENSVGIMVAILLAFTPLFLATFKHFLQSVLLNNAPLHVH